MNHIDSAESIPTHREKFIQEITDSEALTTGTVREFYSECAEEFDFLDSNPDWEEGDIDHNQLDDLYVLVRSFVHMDSRGRSRSFQAIYSFYRSMWAVAFLLGTIYYTYGVAKSVSALNGIVGWRSYFGTLEFPPLAIVFGAAAIIFIAHRIFSLAREDYKKYYVQYLIADFLVLQGLDYPEAVVVADDIDSREV